MFSFFFVRGGQHLHTCASICYKIEESDTWHAEREEFEPTNRLARKAESGQQFCVVFVVFLSTVLPKHLTTGNNLNENCEKYGSDIDDCYMWLDFI